MLEYYLRIFAIKHIFCNFAAVLGKKGFGNPILNIRIKFQKEIIHNLNTFKIKWQSLISQF